MTKVKIIVIAVMLLAVLVFSASFAQKDEKQKPVWEKMFESNDVGKRMAGMQMVLDQYNKIVKDLMDIVNAPVNPQAHVSESQRGAAIELLGKMRATEAVGCIVEWLNGKPGISIEVDPTKLRMFSTPRRALVDIGLPSIPPVAELLKNEWKSGYQVEYLKIILAIKGRAETEFFLENMLAKETNKSKIENIKAARELLKDPKRQGMFNNAASYAIGNVN